MKNNNLTNPSGASGASGAILGNFLKSENCPCECQSSNFITFAEYNSRVSGLKADIAAYQSYIRTLEDYADLLERRVAEHEAKEAK